MGLLQWAVETYDNNLSIVGMEIEGKTPLAPIGHTLTNSQIEIVLDSLGNYVSARKVDASEGKIIIPVTEESAGRTVDPRAHPLCEQLGYLCPENKKKYDLYLGQLESWMQSDFAHPKLKPIFQYVKKGTIVSDLLSDGLIEAKEGKPKDEKLLIRWRVAGMDETDGATWRDVSLFHQFEDYYSSQIEFDTDMVCMVLGKKLPVAKQHMKGVISFNGNAKLISANDSTNFTYRGRFYDDSQASGVSYIASQKAHNALRWLVSNQGVSIGGRTYVCWCPQGVEIPRCTHPLRKKGGADQPRVMPSDYKAGLRDALNSWKNELDKIRQSNVIIASFDAATTGRLAVTYYNELLASDFLERLYDWDSSCAWINGTFGVQSPYLRQIAECAYGAERNQAIQADDRVIGEQVQRLVRCRIDKANMPVNIKRMLVQNASEPQKYKEAKNWNKVLFTACAVIRKYSLDYYKEEWSMALEPERQDRSYQFGRLLAILEKLERDTYHGETGREPNAIRRMPVYCKRPYHTFVQLNQMMEQAYFPHLRPGSRIWYKQQIADILSKLETMGALDDNVRDKALEDTYLLGYYLQRSEMYKGKDTEDGDNSNIVETKEEL